MTLSDADRAALKAHLEWLRLMGVTEIPSRSPDPAVAAPVARTSPVDVRGGTKQAPPPDPEPALPGAPPASKQPDLFGGTVAEPDPDRGARRGRGPAEGRAATPLAELPAPGSADPAGALRLVREEIGDCRRCRLSEKRTQIVFGVGSPTARLMFVGEGPGADEDAQGEPFVGRAGQLLTKIIEAMGLRRADVYIANIVKCRPPENRTPLPDEVATCSPFLLAQIAALRPLVIVCLGTPAAQTLLGTRETITRLRGTFREAGGIKVMPTFHPAYLLRNPAAKREVWDDMKKVMTVLQGD